MLEKYTKVRLTDEDGLNAETAWAFGHCESKTMRTPDNLYLILDNNTTSQQGQSLFCQKMAIT